MQAIRYRVVFRVKNNGGSSPPFPIWKAGRVVEGSGMLSRRGAIPRRFESCAFRTSVDTVAVTGLPWEQEVGGSNPPPQSSPAHAGVFLLLRRFSLHCRDVPVEGSSKAERQIVDLDDVGSNPVLPPELSDVRGVVAGCAPLPDVFQP